MDKKRRSPSSSPIHCSHCQREFSVSSSSLSDAVQFCLYCGHPLRLSEDKTQSIIEGTLSDTGAAALLPGIAPKEEKIAFTLGPYQILRKIGQGGMGEVFLAYDTTCGRRIALKKIRVDLTEHPHLYRRFLKEARITSQLTHPTIIPIYSIHQEQNTLYYTMPYVEGDTLKQILRTTRNQEKKGEDLHPIGGSIPALLRVFVNICHAVLYAHSHGVLHRDLKPENVMIGKFGEVMILDWGLAKIYEEEEAEGEPIEAASKKRDLYADEFTARGKVVGTVSYMPPERALGYPATVQTDIYALGVILYQILTLRLPFRRANLKTYKQKMHKEIFVDPSEVAPYRDVPQMLTRIVKKCLHPNMEQRYLTVEALLRDVENYLQGGAEWLLMASLDHQKKEDWEFQENVLIAENFAITRTVEEAEWFNLMISNASFTGNTKLEARVRLHENSQGVGFLLSVPEMGQRAQVYDGYCLWLGSETHRATRLLCSTVEVIHAPEIFLKTEEWTDVRIEKTDKNIFLYLNNTLQFSYISLMPMMGTHIGFLSRDDRFTLSKISIFVGNLSVTVNCLAIPDAFLAHRDFDTAYSEYRRIGYSFSGRKEGREAVFRAGFTLVEKAAAVQDPQRLYDMALKEFEKLHETPGAPFEYLGKALVYQKLGDDEEEGKCFELAFRRFPHHPLLPNLHQWLLFRLHQSSRKQRRAAYQFALLASHLLPAETIGQHTQKLFQRLEKNWEPLPYICPLPENSTEREQHHHFCSTLAFWTAKPYILLELLKQWKEHPLHPSLAFNIFRHLMELGAEESLQEAWLLFEGVEIPISYLPLAKRIWDHRKDPLAIMYEMTKEIPLNPIEKKFLFFLVEYGIDHERWKEIAQFLSQVPEEGWSNEELFRIHLYRIWCLLYLEEWKEAGTLFAQYPVELLTQESSLLHCLYGCWLQATEGYELALIHFQSVLHVSHPRSWTLLSHYLTDTIREETSWFRNAFLWDKRQLYRQLALYAHCAHEAEKSRRYRAFARGESLFCDS